MLLHVPTLVLNGERTRMWYRLIGQAMAACVPGACAATIEAAGHMAIVGNPIQSDVVNAVLAQHTTARNQPVLRRGGSL